MTDALCDLLDKFDGHLHHLSRRQLLVEAFQAELDKVTHGEGFDRQNLLLVVSDSEFDATQMRYMGRPTVADIDAHVYTQVSGRRIPTNIGYTRDARRFTGEEGNPLYDYATFTIPYRVCSCPLDLARRVR